MLAQSPRKETAKDLVCGAILMPPEGLRVGMRLRANFCGPSLGCIHADRSDKANFFEVYRKVNLTASMSFG